MESTRRRIQVARPDFSMTPVNRPHHAKPSTAEDVFVAAIGLPPGERHAYLQSACGADTSLRAEVELLLQSHEEAGDFLEEPAISLTSPSLALAATDIALPDSIGNFSIKGLLGVGGMGRVYLAESENPRRLVALKVIKPDSTSPSMLRRFQLEAQVVALLQHVGIAQLFEAGTADTGSGPQPFFAMEYVQGPPLLEYVRQNKLSTRKRLELFALVCDAVHHAHQRGVVHRDLKPSNILVDTTGQPKILDFGVARLSAGDTATTTLHTHAGQLIGTLAYMSPEQVSADPGSVDARSDVYSLGVILYELLAGRLPHDVSSRSLPDAMRAIREEAPSSLSTIDRVYRGDVDTIVGRALEKDPLRRYQSAQDLAADIRRHLRDEPIVARPPSAWYELAKFTKRNKAMVSGAAVAFLAVTVGLVIAIWQAREAYLAQEDAQQSEAKALHALTQVDLAREHAEKNLEVANEINALLKKIFASPEPDERLGRDVTVLQVIDRYTSRMEDDLPGPPHVRAALHQTIGDTYLGLSDYAKAEIHFRKAVELFTSSLSNDHPDTIAAKSHLLGVLSARGKAEEALALAKSIYDSGRAIYPPNDTELLVISSNYARQLLDHGDWEQAESIQVRVLQAREASGDADDPLVLLARHNLARVYAKSGRQRQALEIERDVVRRFRASGQPLTSKVAEWYIDLGNDLTALGEIDEAASVCEELLENGRQIFAQDHPAILATKTMYGSILNARKQHDKAEQIEREIVEAHRHDQVPIQYGLARAMSNLGLTLMYEGKLTESEDTLREALAILEKDAKPDMLRLTILNNLAATLRFRKRFRDALPICADIVRTAEQVYPVGDWQIGACKYGYAIALASTGKPEEAETQLKESYEIITKTLKPDDERVVAVMRTFVDLYTHWDKPDQAEIWRKRLPEKYRNE